MRIPFLRSLLASSCLSAGLVTQAQTTRDARQLYAQLCASCHGENLDTGQGGSLVDGVWKHGADDESIARGIRSGFLETGMPAFGEVLREAEIRGLVALIRQAEARGPASPVAAEPVARGRVRRSQEHAFRVETVAERLEVPWSIAFLPDGRALVTERAGRLRVIENGKLLPRAIEGTPQVLARGQGGLLAVAPHPEYASNGWIYLSFSDPGPGGRSLTKVVRGKLRDGRWVEQETIFEAPAQFYTSRGQHFGSRFVFDGDYLFFSIGDRGVMQEAQDLTRPNGKVHRVHLDGRVPKDNPFVDVPNAFPTIWSYGNRNPQGLARHPVTGDLWETEHGPRGGDELNIIRRGRNYGWPVITYGINYNGTPITDRTAQEGMEQPVIHWTPSIAVCGIAFYTGERFPRWQNNLLVTALAFQELRRVVIENNRVTKQEVLLKNIGRMRDVAVGPDGFVYVALEDPGRIVRLVPAE